MRELIFIHGRAQEDKDATQLKRTWIKAWERGLKKSGLELPISDDKIRFPYYGDTLRDITSGLDFNQIADVIVKGDDADEAEREFIKQYLLEVQEVLDVNEVELRNKGGRDVLGKGPQNWEWLQTILQVIDERIPGASGTIVSMVTKDVYRYLRNPGCQSYIDSRVRNVFLGDSKKVVVSHSLGTLKVG